MKLLHAGTWVTDSQDGAEMADPVTGGAQSPRGDVPIESGMPAAFTHVNARGEAHIVDITGKSPTQRRAAARCRVTLPPEALEVLADGVEARRIFAEAQVVGLMAAKRTWRLIPLCHPIKVDDVALDLHMVAGAVEIEAVAEAFERTGLEMEALTACGIAALSIVATFRKFEPKATVGDLTLWEKTGGKSGHWQRASDGSAPPAK